MFATNHLSIWPARRGSSGSTKKLILPAFALAMLTLLQSAEARNGIDGLPKSPEPMPFGLNVVQEVKKQEQQEEQDEQEQEKKHEGPIVEFKKIEFKTQAFEDAERGKPLAIKTLEEAEKYFDEATLERIQKCMEFEERHLLLFAWQGSGRDKLEFAVMESYPEQLSFTLVPGRTRDLRRHAKLYSIRKNVKY